MASRRTYTAADIILTRRGHIYTQDMRYYLSADGNEYHYWCEVKNASGSKVELGYPLGRYSYDYTFRGKTAEHYADLLNKVIAWRCPN